MSTLSDYNNNPGNLRPPKGVTYEGQIGVDDKGFAVFENKEYGQRALLNDVAHKLGNGINTPDKFVDRFSPAGSENEEDARDNYKIYLAQQLGLKSTSDPFPKDAADRLAKAVSAFEGGTWATPAQTEESVSEAAPAAADDGETVKPKESTDIPGVADANRPAIGMIGGVGGAGLSAAMETTKKLAPILPNIINKMTPGVAVNPNLPMSRMGLQRYLNSQIAPNLRLPLTELEKVSGAGKIRTMSEVQTALRAIQAVEEQKVAKPVVKMVPGRPGMFEETGMFRTATTPGRPGVDLTPYEIKSGPARQAIGRELQTAGEVGRAVLPSVAKVGIGGLGAANAAMQGYDAYELWRREGMTPRVASKMAATVGGGLSMLPFGVTQAVGLGLQAPELAWEGYDWLKNRPKGGLPKSGPEWQEPALPGP